MKKLLPIGTLGLAGLVGAGLLAFPATTAQATGDDQVFIKREDNAGQLVLVSDDEDDDDTGGTNTGGNTGGTNTGGTNTGGTNTGGTNTATRTRHSLATNDNTRSNMTKMSRDRDHSHGDLTKDGTRDGGDHTRDLTPNLTNDHSRNDTRGRH